MKKILLTLTILLMPILMFGCQKTITLEDSMSEITKIYFTAENNDIIANISVGEREEDYIIDGKHTKNVDFSLIAIKFNNLLAENMIEAEIIINNVSTKIQLDLNPANHYYMADLGYALNGNDQIQFNYKEYSLNFVKSDFQIDYSQALEIAKSELGEKINKYFNGKNFAGEGYLKVLTHQDEENEQLFWVFTVVGNDNAKNNVVIGVNDGKVLVSD